MKIRILNEAGEPGDVVDMPRQRALRQIEQGLAVAAEEVPAEEVPVADPSTAEDPPQD